MFKCLTLSNFEKLEIKFEIKTNNKQSLNWNKFCTKIFVSPKMQIILISKTDLFVS